MIKKDKYVTRLYQEWKMHGKPIIAVDYDDTIFPWGYKSKEDIEQIQRIVDLLVIAKQTGAYIVIFTCSAPDRHEEIQKYCESIELPIDAINNNPISLPYGNHGKIYANIFLDDRAGLKDALETLEAAMYMVRGDNMLKHTLGESQQ